MRSGESSTRTRNSLSNPAETFSHDDGGNADHDHDDDDDADEDDVFDIVNPVNHDLEIILLIFII